jgi:microcystin-dependent protein
MPRTAEWRDDVSGTITTGGTSTAYTVISNQGFDTLAHMNGAMIAFVPHTTNGATVTLNVDGLGVKPLRYGPGLELQSGILIQGTPYVATYNNSDGAFYLRNFAGNPYGIPLGGLLPYVASSAPNTAFALPFGQAISRATYATLFSLISTTFGVGDGSTTFNIPDIRGRSIFGLDNMGGAAANRITNAGSNIVGTTLGATGGAENHVLTQPELPAVAPTFTGTPSSTGVNYINTGAVGSTLTWVLASGNTFYQNPVTITPAGTISNLGSGNAHPQMPPTIVLPFILRVI